MIKLLFLFILIAFPWPLPAQTATDDRVLRPVRKDLIPVHWPDLASLEQSVREQLAASQDSLIAIAKNPASSEKELGDAFGKLGQIYHAYSLNSPARECYLNAVRLAPKDFRWIYLLAKLDHTEGRFEEAIRGYEAARVLHPNYVAVAVNLGNILLELNRLEEAKVSFSGALEIDENNAAAQYGLGQVALAKRSYFEAVQYFEKVLARVPGANRVHYSLAMAYRGLRDVKKVEAHLAQQGPVGVRVADPLVDGLRELIAGERLYLSRGKVAFEAQRYTEAVAEFSKAVAANSESVTARVNLGAALSQVGDLQGAVEQFEAALSVEPGNVNAHYNLGVLLARRNRHADSIEHLQAALTGDPNDLNARFLLATEFARAGRSDEALMEYSRVVQIDPNNEAALLEQVKLLHRKGQFKQSLERLEEGHARNPLRGRTILMLAYLLATSPQFELRNGARALELAQRVYDVTRAWRHAALMATALAELGRCGEAADWQRQVIALAERERIADVLDELRTSLRLYEDGQSCRPSADTQLKGLLFLDGN
jgi:tetratricopeptide (TPR) repeat protein